MRYSADEKLEIIRLVEESDLPVKKTACNPNAASSSASGTGYQTNSENAWLR
jgi:transposase-like protein